MLVTGFLKSGFITVVNRYRASLTPSGNTTDHPIHCTDRLQRAHWQDNAAGRGRRVARVYADESPASTLTFPPHRGHAHTSSELDNCHSFTSKLP